MLQDFPTKASVHPVSPEIMSTKSKEPLGKNFSVFNLKQAFKLQLVGSEHERKGSTQRAINNLLLYKMLAYNTLDRIFFIILKLIDGM